ncbi:hypothetical protein T10_6734 [Trichinella papuae]|uniref:Uncharacterized protein n=1 Tax=Trichinella papuae TaxID=268474 RepID=A0A0V1N1E3_9BILA|nr:hypothetical protein T10_6734 [Trichinella papuae]
MVHGKLRRNDEACKIPCHTYIPLESTATSLGTVHSVFSWSSMLVNSNPVDHRLQFDFSSFSTLWSISFAVFQTLTVAVETKTVGSIFRSFGTTFAQALILLVIDIVLHLETFLQTHRQRPL